MTERFTEFDGRKVGEALGAEPRSLRDVAHGDGEALNVGDAVVEVYPDAGVTRVTTPDARIELYRVPSYSISGERVVFEQGEEDDRTRLQVRADGKVVFHPVLRATESPRTGEIAIIGHQVSPVGQVSPEITTRPQTTQSAEDEKSGEVEQQVLQGRLGRDPWYSSNGEQPLAGFPLAVNDEQGKTTWHKVIVIGESAEAV